MSCSRIGRGLMQKCSSLMVSLSKRQGQKYTTAESRMWWKLKYISGEFLFFLFICV